MVCLSFKLLVLLMVAFASGKSLDKGKRKIEKVTVKLDNLFDKSNAKQTKTTMDVGFLVENPYKHGKHGFAKSLEFVKSLSKSLQVSDIGNHVGLVTYGKHPYMAFDLNEHFTSSEVENAIKGVPSPSYGSNTGRALMFAKKQLFDSSSRPESRKSLIVLTSKRSTDKVNKAADVLKKSDVTVYTIGVDAKDHMVELNDVASDPIEKHKFLTTSSHLQDMVKQIKDLIWKDGQIIPQVLPPNTESRKTKSTVFLKKSKASDEQPQSRSTVEDSGRILDLGNVGNVENPAESQDELDDGNPQSSPAEPTSLPFEDQDIEPTMAPDSLPHESKKRGSYREKLSLPDSSNQAAEFIVSQNPTISTGPREDNPTQQVAPEETESTATTEIVPEKLFMPTVPSSTPAPLPTKQEKLSMPTVSSSTPAPLPIKQEKLSMPAVPSSTPAPLPNKQEKLSMPTVPSSTPAPLPNKQEKLSMPTVPSSTPAPLPNKQVKLSMPTVPLSTPAPLPNKQASTEVENKTASLISTHFLTPTKPETEKPDASSKSKPIVVASPTKPVAVTVAAPYLKAVPTLPLFFANKKKKPTMPAKELPIVPGGSRRSNITAEIMQIGHDALESKTRQSQPQVQIQSDALESAARQPHPQVQIEHDALESGAKQSQPQEHDASGSGAKVPQSDQDHPFAVFDSQSEKENTNSEHDTPGSGARDTKSGQEQEESEQKSSSENDTKEESEEKETKDDPIKDFITQAKLLNQNDSDETTTQEAKLFNQSVNEEHLLVGNSSKHIKSVHPKQTTVIPRPKPAQYSKTQPASAVLGKECKARVDLAFLLDGSQATGKMRFKKSLEFVKDIIKSFSVSKDDAHVSIAVCSEKPHIIFDLSAFNDHSSMERALRSVTYPNGKMFAGGCLKTIKTGIFENSGRHGVPKILYFMSGGGSKDQVSLPSRALRDLGVQVFSLGLGSSYDARELKEVATVPYSDHVLATRYEILGLLRPYVTAQLCRGSGGKLVSRATVKQYKKPSIKINKEKSERQTKSDVPKTATQSKDESGLRKSILSKLKEKEQNKKAELKADIRKKLHILLSKLGRKFHNENSIYRSIIYNINGHREAGCKDYHVLCKTWGQKGFCKKSSKHGVDAYSVQRVCPKTCVVCYT